MNSDLWNIINSNTSIAMDPKKRIQTAKTIDEYLAALPANVAATLGKVRKVISETIPDAEEVISYQMPAFKRNGIVVYFAAFKNHCSLYTASLGLMKTLTEELKPYKTSGVTIQFPHNKPLPATLIKKIVKARVAEIAERKAKKELSKKSPVKKKAAAGLSDEKQVSLYMNKLEHPLKKEIEALRKIIKSTSTTISERIKWNAPSYYTTDDMLTFNHRATNHVHLVFHHPAIVKIKSDLLHGDYKDRRMVYFSNMKEINAGKKELQRIISELIRQIK